MHSPHREHADIVAMMCINRIEDNACFSEKFILPENLETSADVAERLFSQQVCILDIKRLYIQFNFYLRVKIRSCSRCPQQEQLLQDQACVI